LFERAVFYIKSFCGTIIFIFLNKLFTYNENQNKKHGAYKQLPYLRAFVPLCEIF